MDNVNRNNPHPCAYSGTPEREPTLAEVVRRRIAAEELALRADIHLERNARFYLIAVPAVLVAYAWVLHAVATFFLGGF